ncbi:hypothetical protein OHR86_33000 [Streptomyces sp. NBC_00441]|uniref:hypothetical protein n=1 Tax=Streptomyces sp. NBC_00441 TaxID=2975742 RepID=UPI002E2BDB63|nr:hypothetical protein [Streptomyces sp. NBC_00441]
MSAFAWTAGLPEQSAAAVVEEIDACLRTVPEDAACVATGSLVEGIGNANSDIDLYIIRTAGPGSTNPVAIGIRDSRYVDCEYLDLGAMHQLATAFADPKAADRVATFALRDFDRYYRLAICARLRVTDEVASVLDLFSAERSCALFNGWCMLSAHTYLARAAVAQAMDEIPRAVLLLRRAAVWRAASVLAEGGEGYPSLKWTTVKAARLFGAGTAAQQDCLDGCETPPEDLGAALPRLRARIHARREPAHDPSHWRLADSAGVVPDGAAAHLVLGRKAIVRTDGLTALLVRRLHDGTPWPEAVENTAADLGVPATDVHAAAAAPARELAAAGYLTLAGGKDACDVPA